MENSDIKKREDNPLIKQRVVRRGEEVIASQFEDLSKQDEEMESFLRTLTKKKKNDPTLTTKTEKEKLSVKSFLKKMDLKKFIFGFYRFPAKTPEEIEIINFGKKVK